MLRLQSNVPLPKSIRPTARGRRRKYPFEAMQIGDFFFVPGIKREQIHGHVWNVGRKLSRKFRVRVCYMRERNERWEHCEADDLDAVLGVGVWRIE